MESTCVYQKVRFSFSCLQVVCLLHGNAWKNKFCLNYRTKWNYKFPWAKIFHTRQACILHRGCFHDLKTNYSICIQYEAKKLWRFRSFPFRGNGVTSHFHLPFSCIVQHPFSVPYALLVMPTCNWNVWTLLLGLMNGAILPSYELHRRLLLLNCTCLQPLLWKFQLRSCRLALSLPPTDRALEFNCRTQLRWSTMVLLINWHSSPLLLLNV